MFYIKDKTKLYITKLTSNDEFSYQNPVVHSKLKELKYM